MKDFSLLFLSTFDYPSRYAHALQGIAMARAFARALPGRFLFLINTAVTPELLADIPYRRLFGRFGRRIKKLGLRRLLLMPIVCIRLATSSWSVVYTTDPGLYGFAAWLKRLFGVRVVVECHGPLSLPQARALKKADAAIFVTEGLKKNWGTSDARSHVLSNAVDVSLFSQVQDDMQNLRTELALPGGFLVGYVGRFEPLGLDKGLRLMIDAVTEFEDDVHVLLVGGSKSEVIEYESYVREKKLTERVTIVGHVASRLVPRYMKACDVLAYVPERNQFTEEETSPMKVFEYFASGRPVILSDTNAFREITNEDEVVFIEPERTQYVGAVNAMRANPLTYQERAARALASVAKNTWDARVARVVQLIEDVV